MRIEESIDLLATPDEIWPVISSAEGLARVIVGVTRWEVEGRRKNGLGTRYRMLMEVGSAQVGGLIEVVECDEPSDFAWTSITGIDQRGRWRIRAQEDGTTRVTLRLSYHSPGGFLAAVTDQISSRIVKGNIKESLERLRADLEGETVSKNETRVGPLTMAVNKLHTARVLAGAGFVKPVRPDRVLRTLGTLRRWGPTPAAGFAGSAIRYPDDTAIVDELGTLTFEQVHRRSNAIASSLSDSGVLEGDLIGVMCRNHRGFIETVVALSKLGAHGLYLNTAFAGPQLTEVVKREKPTALIFDEEFYGLLEDAGHRRKRFVAWHDSAKPGDPTLDELIESGDDSDPVPPEQPGRTIILTSGTTGSPKGAARSQPETLDPAAALLSKIPLKSREKWLIAAPLFHSWGFAHFTLGLVLSSTYVLQRKFDPEQTLAAAARHEVTSIPMVPVMVQRIMELPKETRDRYDLSTVKCIPLSGSALPGDLAIDFMDEFGDILYNLYGSTEVAWATIATPADLRAAPGTAGKAPRGTVVKIYDEAGRDLPTGQTGRIFVGNEMLFEGYTGGGNKDMLNGLMSSGDTGHLDDQGRLFVEGRSDEMIVSGGENVFPAEVEDLLAKHQNVAEAAVIGVEDEKFGQRLKAYVVKRGSVSEKDLQDYVKSNLARYKVPREVEFLKELPRNATGKVLKRELKEQHENGSKPTAKTKN
jgi:acyl-CoA synthetase (AMP-forming)/AMP-acid ligase II/carbon monoxide dehydrogenase subunit G